MKDKYNIAHLTTGEFAKAIQNRGTLIVPVASIEVLGSHGPLGADYLAANAVVPLVAERAQVHYAPTIPYGDTLELPQWAGSVDVGEAALASYLEGVARSFFNTEGLKNLVFISFHSLNLRAIDSVCRKLAKEGKSTFTVDWWRTVGTYGGELIDDQAWGFGHGGELISSVLAHLAPEVFSLDTKVGELPKEGFGYYKDHLPFGTSPFSAYGTFDDYCTGGAWGELTGASKEKGAELTERAIAAIVSFIAELRTR